MSNFPYGQNYNAPAEQPGGQQNAPGQAETNPNDANRAQNAAPDPDFEAFQKWRQAQQERQAEQERIQAEQEKQAQEGNEAWQAWQERAAKMADAQAQPNGRPSTKEPIPQVIERFDGTNDAHLPQVHAQPLGGGLAEPVRAG